MNLLTIIITVSILALLLVFAIGIMKAKEAIDNHFNKMVIDSISSEIKETIVNKFKDDLFLSKFDLDVISVVSIFPTSDIYVVNIKVDKLYNVVLQVDEIDLQSDLNFDIWCDNIYSCLDIKRLKHAA